MQRQIFNFLTWRAQDKIFHHKSFNETLLEIYEISDGKLSNGIIPRTREGCVKFFPRVFKVSNFSRVSYFIDHHIISSVSSWAIACLIAQVEGFLSSTLRFFVSLLFDDFLLTDILEFQFVFFLVWVNMLSQKPFASIFQKPCSSLISHIRYQMLLHLSFKFVDKWSGNSHVFATHLHRLHLFIASCLCSTFVTTHPSLSKFLYEEFFFRISWPPPHSFLRTWRNKWMQPYP